MTSDLETMLRTSLRERAEDVEPTPELWSSVQRKVVRRRAVPLLIWTAAGVAAAVTAAVVVPGLLDGATDRFTIEPGENVTSTATEDTDGAPAPGIAAPLSHYVAVVDGRLVLRGLDGSEEVLWEGEAQVQNVAVRPGSTPDDLTVAFVTAAEGMLDLRVLRSGETTNGVVELGPDLGDGAVVPTPTWSPDGETIAIVVAGPAGADLVLADLRAVLGDGSGRTQRGPLAGIADETRVRVQDWTESRAGQRLLLTTGGRLFELQLRRTETGWERGSLADTDAEQYVVDIATAPDGTEYRLLAGEGDGAGDAEDAGLALEFDGGRLSFGGLATASPAEAWMTATDGGAILGLGSDAYLVLRDQEGDSPVTPIVASYAAWVDGGAATEPTMEPTTPTEEPTGGEGPRADGPLSASGMTPYVAIDEEGRLAVHTGDGSDREVILDEQLWAPQAGVRVLDASVRPGSSPGDVSGVALLATEGGAELVWFRAAAGATATARMEGASGLGTDGSEQRDAPTWSPDGRHIAWVEPADGGGWTLRTLGMAADGPTDDDAGFGLDVEADVLHAAGWSWEEGASAVGGVTLLAHEPGRSPDEQAYRVPIERQGDGALAVTGPVDPVTGLPMSVADLGFRDGRFVVLHRGSNGWVVRQDGGDAHVPALAGLSARDLDLDVLDAVSVVTVRATGEAFVVDLAGEVTPLDAGRPVRGLDPIR